MRTVESHLLGDKIDEAVTHYINTHQSAETVHVDPNLSLNIQDDGGGRVVTVMHPQGYQQQVCRQISVGEQIGDGPWAEELWDGRLAALVAHLAQPSRTSHHQGQNPHHKPSTVVRNDMDASVILDGSMRLFNGQSLEHHQEQLSVQVSDLPLPPLQDMKRCPDTGWFNKKNTVKGDSEILEDSRMLEMACGSPAQSKQNKKSLPHKKRISRKLKRNTGNTTPSQQDIVVIQCSEEVQPEQEEILPDSFVDSLPRHHDEDQLPVHTHVPQIRAVLVCQLCGQFFGEEQLKFYHHLRHHYEPPVALSIDNPVPDIAIDKITNTCIVDNGATLPDSIVELSLENTVPKTMYQPIDKHILYEKPVYKYSMVMEKSVECELDDSLDKLEFYCCVKCNKSFRKQKQFEAHLREMHTLTKLEDMGEFSEPEDLMEGIHVAVDEDHEQEPEPANGQTPEQDAPDQYDAVLPHLTVDNGHVHQEHIRHWYSRSGGESPEVGSICACGGTGCCPMCAPPYTQQRHQVVTRELQSLLETNIPANPTPENHKENEKSPKKGKKKSNRKFECVQCGRVFEHRNSMLYHLLMHQGKKHPCPVCGKRFFTTGSLKVHKRTHDGVKPWKCEECGQRFRRSGDLKYHKDSKHSTEKRFKCEFCVKEFSRRYSLSVHRRIHTGERNYPCDICHKSFRAASYKQIHMRTHTGVKPYQCEHCNKCFRVPYDLRRHVRVVHEKIKKEDDPKKKDKNKKEEKPKTKETKKKTVKPPNVTIQKSGKLTELGSSQCKDFYYADQDIKQEMKFRNEIGDEFRDNTDGKMPIFSNVEKSGVVLNDLRSLDTSRRDVNGDIEMFDKLALYSMPAV
ncbi:unnamed protein product [Pieris brassicae]|uniref:C2H2-type domain-containing protein n=1 Tax=Pieris brassicae TaxID=7116 RepID=A0A9P0TYU1_PIEBR|nr:unnamed protein product [Pieris brassicae]